MANGPLVLVLDAQTGPLKSALKDAGTSLADYSKSAQDIMAEVQDAMQNDLADGAEAMAARMSKSLQQQINLMRRQAASALSQGQDYNPMGGMNSASSIAAAEAQERLAQTYRDQAAAAAVATAADENQAVALRQVAVASELAAVEATRQAQLLRTQAGVFAAIEAEMGVAADEGATRVVGSHNRMSVSSMLLMHSIRSAGDSFAAGLPITTIFAEQVGRLGEAAELSQGSFGTFGALLSGPWGIAMMAGVSVLGIMIRYLTESGKEADRAADAHETLADKINLAKHSYDEIIGALREYNNEQARSRTLALDEARALKEKTDALLRAAVARRQELAAQLESTRMPVGFHGEASAASANTAQANEARETQQRIDANNKAIQELQSAAQNATGGLATEMAKIATDPKYAIEQRFTRLRNEAQGSIHDVGQLTQRLADLNRQEDAALDALKPEKVKRERRSPIDRTPGHDSDYDAEYDRLTQQLDQANAKGVTDPAQLAQLKKNELDDANQKAKDAILAKARRDDWSKADTDVLLLKEDELTAAQKNDVDLKLKADLAKRATDAAAKAITNQIAQLEITDKLLALQEQLVTTHAERVKIQQQILADEQQIALLKIQEKATREKSTPAEVAQQTAAVNQEYAAKNRLANQNNDPAAKYLAQINQSSSLNGTETIQSAEAAGLKSLTDGLTGVVSGTESASAAFRKMANSIISDLARIEIEKLIVGIFGNGNGGGASIGSMVGGGSIDTAALGLADGGLVFGPGGPREDKVPAMLSAGEYVVNAAATRKHAALLHAINGGHVGAFADGGLVGADIGYPRLPSAASLRTGGGSSAPLTFDLRGAVMTEDLLKQMHQISAQHAAGVLMTAPGMTQRNLADQQRMRIPS